MLGGGKMKELYELKGEGCSIRGIARELGISRNTVRKYVRSPEVPKPMTRAKRGTKLDAYKEYLDVRLAEGLENCVVLLREIRELGYDGRLQHAEELRLSEVQAASAEGDDAVRDRTRRAGAGGLGSRQLQGRGWAQASYVGVRDGAGLLAYDLRGVREACGRSNVHQVPPERLRLLRRGAEALPVRQRQGGGYWTGR